MSGTVGKLKRTPLYEAHVALGAKMVDFAGYEMPVDYGEGIVKEHMAVRESAGLFDVAHMGDLLIRGPKALEVVQAISANDASKLEPGHVQYSYMPYPNGESCGVVDDFLVFRLQDRVGGFLIVPNASNYAEVRDRIQSHCASMGLESMPCGGKLDESKTTLEDASDRLGQLALQGPRALEIAQKLTSTPVKDLPMNRHVICNFAGFDGVIVSTTGYTGAGGCEVYAYNENLLPIWNAILEAGEEFGIRPAGLGARDSLRMEAGFCLYGHELNKENTPYAAGLGWCTKLVDGKPDLVGRKQLEGLKAKGNDPLKLVSFVMDKKGPAPREGYALIAEGHEGASERGVVTSGGPSPCLNVGIGMGYLPRSLGAVDGKIIVEIPARREGDEPRRLTGRIVKSALGEWKQ